MPFDLTKVTEIALRSELMRRTAMKRTTFTAGPGRPRSKSRCPCGQSTLQRAASRNFDCCRKSGVVVESQGRAS